MARAIHVVIEHEVAIALVEQPESAVFEIVIASTRGGAPAPAYPARSTWSVTEVDAHPPWYPNVNRCDVRSPS